MLPTLAAYLHRLDPFAIEFSKGFGIRWYGLSYLAGFLVGYLLIRRIVRVGVSTLKPQDVGDMVVAGAIGVFLGGRLGYALFYDRALFYTFTSDPPWWNLLAIQRGGMASHGGILGFVLAMLIYARRRGHSWAHLLDLGAFGAPIGLFFGRIANFINGELFGRACDPHFPLAVKFPREIYEWSADQRLKLQPVYDALPPLPPSQRGNLDEQVIRAVQAGNQQVIDTLRPLLTPRHPSQLYEALLEGVVVFLVLAFVWRKPCKPLVVGGWFMVTYGVVRVFVEFFRQPDEGIPLWWNFSRGQWLSLPLVLGGLLIIVLASRRNVPRLGGWMPQKKSHT